MFDETESNLGREIEAAVEFRKRHTDVSAKLIKRYAGRNYRSDWKGDPVYKPHEFEFIVNMLPQLAYTNPKCEAESDMPGVADFASESVEFGINGILPQINFARTAREVALDTYFDFGVFLTHLEPTPGFEDSPEPPLRTVVSRISPRMFFMDPRASRPWFARYAGHFWIRDRQSLKEEMGADGRPVYDSAKIDAIPMEAGEEDLAKELLRPSTSDDIERDDIICVEMWVPENGKVYTLGVCGGKGFSECKMIRAPRPYVGPKTGPYRLSGIYTVPDQLYPLPALAVSMDKVTEFNSHAAKASRDSAASKRMVFVDANNAALSEKVQISPDGTVVRVPGFVNQFAQVEFGGTQPATMDYLAVLREDLDRQSGLSDVQRGDITGNATATEVSEATAAASIRTRAAQAMFRETVAGVLSDMAEIMWESPQVQFTVPYDDEATGEKVTMLFVGGMAPEMPYSALRITIEPYSMEMVSQAQQTAQATELVTVMMQAVPMIAQFPTFPWDKLFNDFGESRNRKDLGDRYARPFMQQALVQQQIMALATAEGQDRDAQAKAETKKGAA